MWRVILAVLRRLPQGVLSRAFGWLADRRIPRPLRRPVLGGFARFTGILTDEAERPLAEYTSVNQLFVRRLRPGARSWPHRGDVLASPVDGVLGESGRIRDGTLIQAKGLEYTVEELLGPGGDPDPPEAGEGSRESGTGAGGGEAVTAGTFFHGSFFTLYLAPRHYHRIHTPAPGTILRAFHVPGALLPVNPPTVARVEGLFARNERLAALMETAMGPLAVVAVGAYNVGRISTAFDPAWSGERRGWITNRRHPLPGERRYDPPVTVSAGDELMAFHLGSTVILLTRKPLELVSGVGPGREVRAGEILARPSA